MNAVYRFNILSWFW